MRTLSTLLFLAASLYGQQSVMAHRSTSSLINIYSSAPMGANVATTLPASGMVCWLKPESLTGADGSGISAWADSSAGGCSVAQVTTANQPKVAQNAYFSYAAARFTRESSHYFNVTSLSVSTNAFSIFYALRRRGNMSTTREVLMYGDAAHRLYNNFRSGNFAKSRTSNSNEFYDAPSGQHIPTGPMMVGWVEVTAATSGFWRVGATEQSGNFTQTSETENIVTMGANSTPGEYYAGDIFEVLVYNRAVTSGERTTINSYFDQRYGTARSGDWQIIFDGNSLASGYNDSDGVTSPMTMLQDYFQHRHTWWHESYPGKSTEQLTSEAGNTIDFWIPNGFGNTAIIMWEISNSMANGDTGLVAAAAVKAYADARKAANPAVKIIVATCLPRATIDDTQRRIANAQLFTDLAGGHYDAVADVGGDPIIGATSAYTNGTYYTTTPDTIHLRRAGLIIAYPYFRDALLSVGVY